MRKLKPSKKLKPHSAIKISACYIVKNEANNLSRSIDSLKTQVDEIIVVDTGSTDDTIAIAKSYGAKVIETEWQGDFSTPRNLAIDNASGDWIIFLDADEFFANPNKVRSSINKLINNDAILIPRINIDESKGGIEISRDWNPRIFKNVDYLRYRGLIHENITNLKGSLQYTFAGSELTIYHTGYAAPMIKSKHQRNLMLIEKEIKLYGREPKHDIALVDCYVGLEDYEKVIYYAQKVLNSESRTLTGRGRIYRNLINAMYELKYPDEERLKVAEEAIKTLPQLPDFYALRAIILCDLNRLDEAYVSFKSSLEVWRNMTDNLHEDSYFGRMANVVYAQLAELEALNGNYKEAQQNIKEAIKLAPNNELYIKRSADFKLMTDKK